MGQLLSDSAAQTVPGDVVLLLDIPEELGLGDKVPHQGEQTDKPEGGAEQEEQHPHNGHAGVEERQVEAVHTFRQEIDYLIMQTVLKLIKIIKCYHKHKWSQNKYKIQYNKQ